MFSPSKEALDQVSVSIEEGAEDRVPLAVRHRLDVGPGAACGQGCPQGIGVVSAVGEKHVAFAEAVEHVGGAATVMRLALGQLERDRQAVGIDQRVDLGRQAAARATHATGSFGFFWALAAC